MLYAAVRTARSADPESILPVLMIKCCEYESGSRLRRARGMTLHHYDLLPLRTGFAGGALSALGGAGSG